MMDNANRIGPINASSADILDMRTETLDIVKHDNAHAVVNAAGKPGRPSVAPMPNADPPQPAIA